MLSVRKHSAGRKKVLEMKRMIVKIIDKNSNESYYDVVCCENIGDTVYVMLKNEQELKFNKKEYKKIILLLSYDVYKDLL